MARGGGVGSTVVPLEIIYSAHCGHASTASGWQSTVDRYAIMTESATRRVGTTPFTTESMTCFLAWGLVVLLFPLHLLLWATESKGTKIRRARATGNTWKQIATRYNVSPTTVRRWSMA